MAKEIEKVGTLRGHMCVIKSNKTNEIFLDVDTFGFTEKHSKGKLGTNKFSPCNSSGFDFLRFAKVEVKEL